MFDISYLLSHNILFDRAGKQWTMKSILTTTVSILPRLITIIALTCVYLIGRYYFEFLSIHKFMFQDIISPYYNFKGLRRFWNYIMITAIHFLKGLYLDPIGVAHEYAYNCVPELKGMTDLRLLWPFAIYTGFAGSAIVSLRLGIKHTLYYLVFAAWFATLFPITGIITTGTFIADRLVVPCTVASSIYIAKGITYILFDKPLLGKYTMQVVVPLILCYFANISDVTFKLTQSWTSRPSMLKMTIDACPNNIKAITEMGIIQLQPEKFGYEDPELAM